QELHRPLRPDGESIERRWDYDRIASAHRDRFTARYLHDAKALQHSQNLRRGLPRRVARYKIERRFQFEQVHDEKWRRDHLRLATLAVHRNRRGPDDLARTHLFFHRRHAPFQVQLARTAIVV